MSREVLFYGKPAEWRMALITGSDFQSKRLKRGVIAEITTKHHQSSHGSTWSNLVPVLTNRRLIAVIRYQPGMDYDCNRFFAHCTNQRDSRYLINYKLAKATISWRPTKSTTRFKTITTIVVDQPSDLVPANAARLICPSTNGGINLFPSWLISLFSFSTVDADWYTFCTADRSGCQRGVENLDILHQL